MGSGAPPSPFVETASKADQKTILSKLNDISTELVRKPSVASFWGMLGTVAVIALTVVALIIGGMAYLKDWGAAPSMQAPAPPQIIIVPPASLIPAPAPEPTQPIQPNQRQGVPAPSEPPQQ